MTPGNMILIISCIWVCSMPIGYLCGRWSARVIDKRWRQNDRLYAMTFSVIYGPLMPAMAVLIVLFYKLTTSDWANREVRW